MTYQSKFGNWDNRASVRTKPRRHLADHDTTPLFFPPESVPAATHALVTARGPDALHRILVHSLYQYLRFTTVLEQAAVLPVTARISLGDSGVDLPARMRRDAFKITTDEAWHAQFSDDFADEVARVTEIAPEAVVRPQLLGRLERIRLDVEPGLRNLVELVFAVVSETLVSGLLSDIPKDGRLPAPVRALVADHAADEGRHHAYFRSFLSSLWPQLSARERQVIGPRVPGLVHAFLAPDLVAVRATLRAGGLPEREAAEIMADSYGPDSSAFLIEPAARATVRGFREIGALDDPATLNAFAASGLLADR